MNWNSMTGSNDRSYEELHQILANGRGSYYFDHVEMPNTCGGKICNIQFLYINENKIILKCSDAPIVYKGKNPEIRRWFTTGCQEFSSFNELKQFLRSFPEDFSVEEQMEMEMSEADDINSTDTSTMPDYDKDAITLPNDLQSYTVIDRIKLGKDLSQETFGQEENLEKIAHLVANHLGKKNHERPLSIFLYGASGTGKSSVLKQLVTALNKQITNKSKKYAYRSVDCTQFQEKYDISRLIGAAPGYIGFTEPGVFSVFEENPRTVLVFEEIEKAAPNVTETIMEAIDTGRQETNGKTLSNGKMYYDLSQAMIFFTSNVDINNGVNHNGYGFNYCEDIPETNLIEPELPVAVRIRKETDEARMILKDEGHFRKEVLGRIDAFIKFNSLSGTAIRDIVVKQISNLAYKDHRLCLKHIDTPILQEVLDLSCGEAIENFGTRAVKNTVNDLFNEPFMLFSHDHEDYIRVNLAGSLKDIRVERYEES